MGAWDWDGLLQELGLSDASLSAADTSWHIKGLAELKAWLRAWRPDEKNTLLNLADRLDPADPLSRAVLHQTVAAELLQMEVLPDESQYTLGSGGGVPPNKAFTPPTACLVIGPPGAGKSTQVQGLVQSGFFWLSADLAKRKLPEFAVHGAGAVHQESVMIADKLVLELLLISQTSFVWEKIGADATTLQHIASVLKAAGYRTKLILVHAPHDECCRRVFVRLARTGRFVTMDSVIDRVDERPIEAFLYAGALFDEREAFIWA